MKRKLVAVLAAVMCLLSVFSLAACAKKYKVNEKESLLVGRWEHADKFSDYIFYEDGSWSIGIDKGKDGPNTFRYTETKADEFGTYYEYSTSELWNDQVTYTILRYYPDTDTLRDNSKINNLYTRKSA